MLYVQSTFLFKYVSGVHPIRYIAHNNCCLVHLRDDYLPSDVICMTQGKVFSVFEVYNYDVRIIFGTISVMLIVPFGQSPHIRRRFYFKHLFSFHDNTRAKQQNTHVLRSG